MIRNLTPSFLAPIMNSKKVLYAQFFVNRKTPIELMGSQIDVIKLRSSLALFMRLQGMRMISLVVS